MSKLCLPGAILFQQLLPKPGSGCTASKFAFHLAADANQLLKELRDFLRQFQDVFHENTN